MPRAAGELAMIELYVIRHGETEWNRRGMFQGQTDIPLNTTGRLQARQVALKLKQEAIGSIRTSDLLRALETARPIARESGIPVIRDRRLREICFGAWEGLRFEQVKERFPQEWDLWLKRDVSTAPPQGESFAQVLERAQNFLADVAGEVETGRVAVVTHGGILRAFQHLAVRNDSGNWQVGKAANGSITLFRLLRGKLLPAPAAQ